MTAMMRFSKPSRRVILYSVWFNIALTGLLLLADFYFKLWG